LTKRCRALSGHSVVEGKDFKSTAWWWFTLVRTPFAFDMVENSVRTVVDGDGVRAAFCKGPPTKGTRELVVRLRRGYL